MPAKAAFYIDGFNLYHSINDLNAPHLKWINLWKLASVLIPRRSETLEKVLFCTAIYPDASKRARHLKFLQAQEHFSVEILYGHFVVETISCRSCENNWRKPTEKQTDINIAVSIIDDAYRGVFDHAYLVTNDTDQAALAKLLKTRFPDKRLTIVCPPRRAHAKHLLTYADGKVSLGSHHLEPAVMEGMIRTPRGLIVRPREYDPPPGWGGPSADA
jgi:uncharacterized LabA/DUF88 family protein